MRQKNVVASIRAMVRLGVTSAALGTLFMTAPVGAQTSAGNTGTATADQAGRMAPQGTTSTAMGTVGSMQPSTMQPSTMQPSTMQPSTMQPASGMMTGAASDGMGSNFYSAGRRFPWGLLGLIGLLGLWPRSGRDRTAVD